MISALKTQPGREQRFSYAFILVFIILAATIVAAGYFYYWNYAKHYRREMERRISAIAELKKGDLVQWRKERLADASVFYKDAVFSAVVQRYFEKPEDAEAQIRLQSRLSKVQESDQYARVFLLDAHSAVRMSFPEAPVSVASILTQRISETLRSGQVTFVDFFRNEVDQRIYLGVLVPILDGQDGKQSIGILALLIDPEQYLYPYINRWPTTDKTAETLLVRRDGNDVLFLNRLKFNTNAALSVRMPLTNTGVAAVKAATGKEGIVQAIDYRGVPVMADVHAIPDSPWFMVTRVDTSEIYAPLRERFWLIFAIVGILLTLVGLSFGLIQRQQKVRFYLMQYEIMKKMHESEEDLAITLRSIGDAVIATDTEGRVTRMNPVAEQLTGWSLAEASGKPMEDVFRIINAQTRAPVQNPITKVLASGRVVGLANHTALIARDGTVRQITDSAAPIRDEEGRIRGVVLVFHDVTAEYRIKEALEMGREVLQILNEPGDLQDSIKRVLAALKARTGFDAVGIRLQDGDDFPYLAQQGFSKDFLLTENTLIERAADGGVCRDKDGNPRLECTCGLVISGKTDPANPLFTPGGSYWTNDSFPLLDIPPGEDPRFHPRNQCIHQGYASVALVPIRNKDRIIGLIQLNDRCKGRFTLNTVELLEGIAAHIGAALMRKQVEDALREAKAGLEEKVTVRTRELKEAQEKLRTGYLYTRSLIEASLDPLVTISHEGKITDVNEATIKATGLSKEKLIGTDFSNYFTEPEKAREGYQRVFTRGFVSDYPLTIRRKDGKLSDVLYNAAVYKDKSGNILGVFAAARDITELKYLQDKMVRSEKLAVVGQLASSVAHELRNPLGVIKNAIYYLNMLEFGKDNPDIKENLGIISAEIENSDKIISDLLEFSRIKQPALKPEEINLIIKETLNRVSAPAGIKVVMELGENLPPIQADALQMQLVFFNLAVNAIQAMEQGGTLVISTRKQRAANGEQIEIAFRDTGVGIPKANLPKIFEPLFSTKTKGTGLGLAVVASLVEGHGGKIAIESEVGKGSTFTVKFPVKQLKADK